MNFYFHYRIYFIIILLAGMEKCVAQQCSIHGVVSIFNSQTNTGKREYVLNALVSNEFGKAQATTTDSHGQFSMIYIKVQDKDPVSFVVTKENLEVVNFHVLQAVCGQIDTVKISMAPRGIVSEYRKQIYKVGKTQAEKSLEIKLKQKDRQLQIELAKNKKNEQLILELTNEKALLIAQKNEISAQAEELAQRYSLINLDDVAPVFKNAFLLFQQGELDASLKTINQTNLHKVVSGILKEQADVNQRQVAVNKTSTATKELIRLKIDLHKTRYEYDSIFHAFELLLKIDSFNTNILAEYGHLLFQTKNYLRARRMFTRQINLLYGLLPYQNNSSVVYDAIAVAYLHLGLAYEFNNELVEAKDSYSTSLYLLDSLASTDTIDRNYLKASNLRGLGNVSKDLGDTIGQTYYLHSIDLLSKLYATDSLKYLPEIARVLNGFGSYCRLFDIDSMGEYSYVQSIKAWEKLISHGLPYKADLAQSQSNLANLYSQQDRDEKALPYYQASLLSRRIMAATDHAQYDADLANALDGYCICTRKLGMLDSARFACNEVVNIYTRLNKMYGIAFEPNVARSQSNLAMFYFIVHELDSAVILFVKSFSTLVRLSEKYPKTYAPLLHYTFENMIRSFHNLIMWEGNRSFMHNKRHLFESVENNIVKLAPQYPEQLELLEQIYLSYIFDLIPAKYFSSAEYSARNAQTLFPHKPVYKLLLAHSLLLQDKYEECKKEYGEIKKMDKELVKDCLLDLEFFQKSGLQSKFYASIMKFLKEK